MEVLDNFLKILIILRKEQHSIFVYEESIIQHNNKKVTKALKI